MRHILIIGGSKGIGKATLNLLISSHKVTNFSRTAPALTHANLTHHGLDVLEDQFPNLDTVDGIIYCPGSINLKPMNRLSMEDFKSDFDINVLGAVRVIQHYLPQLKQSSNPSVVLFSTVAVKLGMPFHASIAVAKAGVEGLTKTLAAEFAPLIRVNAIAPTVTNTDLAAGILRNDRIIDSINERHPLKHFLNPDDAAHLAVYLLGEQSRSMTGQVIQLDSGIVSVKL
jgi:3-oxoacyl-[acyl-carrier protein] reductase